MADDRVASEIVSEFFLNTCQRRRLNRQDLWVMTLSLPLANVPHDDDVDAVTTGSVAEFYMQPMLPCFGDLDIMWRSNVQLVIPEGYAPPTQLPAEFHSHLQVYEMIDIGVPGYVNLKLRYILHEFADTMYNAVQCQRRSVVHNTGDGYKLQMHGPAFVFEFANPRVSYFWRGGSVTNEMLPQWCSRRNTDLNIPTRDDDDNFSMDAVYCMRCLSWPPQASEWPTRYRHYGWPDSATVDRVVNSECGIVQVAHPLWRQDKKMGIYQFRLSFSRAEILLLNSWMPVQQIVYHMLRVYVKTEKLTDIRNSAGIKILSNYNIKTLMLWACEKMWWIDNLNIVGMCVELLHILADWLTHTNCPHYFVNNSNMFDFVDKSDFDLTETTAGTLMSLTEARLAEWYVNNYIRKCALQCDKAISRLFQDVSKLTGIKLENAVSAVVNWRLDGALVFAWAHFSAAQEVIHIALCPRLTLESCFYWIRELTRINQHLSVYFTAVTFLHVAFKINKDSLTDKMLDVLSTTCLQFNVIRRCITARHSSVWSLRQAAKLMKVVASNTRSTVQLIEIEASKAYLYRALRCKDSDSESVYCLANVYLAVLCYTTGQYQTAIDHCALVTRSQDHSQCSSHAVQGELLPKTDDDIDTVLGLSVHTISCIESTSTTCQRLYYRIV